jgi:hypothetical protein
VDPTDKQMSVTFGSSISSSRASGIFASTQITIKHEELLWGVEKEDVDKKLGGGRFWGKTCRLVIAIGGI